MNIQKNTNTTNKLLVVYNTCGLSGRDNSEYYVAALNTILAQKINGMKIVMSDCGGHSIVRNKIVQQFGNNISYNFINEILPIATTFNHSVLEGVKEFGQFDSYLYVDSGVYFTNTDQLSTLYNLLNDGPHGIVSSRVNDDSGVFVNFGLGEHEGDQSQEYKLFERGDFTIPVGKAINCHVTLWSNKLLQHYKRLQPDIFAGWCGESTWSFICAAVKQKWVISKDVIVNHNQGVDGQSSGFNPQVWKMQGNKNIDHPFLVSSVIDIMKNGQKHGLGYEEAQNVVMHDPTQYDDNGYCTNDQLKEYIRDNLFLSTSLLDYDRIKHTWIT